MTGFCGRFPVCLAAEKAAKGAASVLCGGPACPVVTAMGKTLRRPAGELKTVTGDTVTITDGIAGLALQGLTAEITPAQSGSGDPSPSNVRPISGRTGVAVTQNGASAVSVEFPETPGTVYGGTLDLKTGLLTVTHAVADLTRSGVGGADSEWGTEPWQLSNSSYQPEDTNLKMFNTRSKEVRGTLFPGLGKGTPTASYYYDNGLMKCSHFAIRKVTSSGEDPNGTHVSMGLGVQSDDSQGRIYITIPASIASTNAQLKAWILAQSENNTPLQVVYPLAEPVTYQLTPQQMPAMTEGTNVLAADSGKVTVTYYAEPGNGG